jgi:hypothetical protein
MPWELMDPAPRYTGYPDSVGLGSVLAVQSRRLQPFLVTKYSWQREIPAKSEIGGIPEFGENEQLEKRTGAGRHSCAVIS